MASLGSPVAAFLPSLLGLTGPLAAQTVKLSEPLALEMRAGRVTDFLFTPDGARILYRADRNAELVFELFSVPLDHATPGVRLNADMHAQGDVGGNSFVPGGQFALGAGERVVYRADQTSENVFELHCVPADASASPVRLTPLGSSVREFQLAPGGTRAAYLAAPAGTFDYQLFSVAIDGSSAPVALAPGQSVNRFWLSSDGTTTVFATWAVPFWNERLHAVPTDGSASALPLDESDGPPPSSFGWTLFRNLEFAPDGLHVVYHEILDEDDYTADSDLFSARLDGSQPAAKLNQQSYSDAFAFDPDAPHGRVAFTETGRVSACALDGSQHAQLSPAGWSIDNVPLAVAGGDVVFSAWNSARTLFRAPLDGSQPALALMTPSAVSMRKFAIVDSSTVAFIATTIGSQFQGLYSVSLAGGSAPVLLTPPPMANRSVGDFRAHPSRAELVFIGDMDTAGQGELFLVPLDGSQSPRRLNAPLIAAGDVRTFGFAPDGESVAYLADQRTDERLELFGAPLDGSGPVLQHNEPITTGAVVGDVASFLASPDGSRVAYRADQELDETFELYSAATDARGQTRSLSAALPGNPGVLPGFVFTPGGERIVFQSQLAAQFALYAASSTAAAPPLELDGSPGEIPFPFEITPDGTRVAYRSASAGSDYALRSAPMDGSSPPITLHPTAPAGRAVTEFRVSPDGQLVVYLADHGANERFELYSVPVDGSSSPVRLNTSLPTGADVRSFRISADAAHVVYLANRRIVDQVELYVVPIQGGRPAERLNDALVSGGDVTDFAIAPDSSRVVYRADQIANNRFDLFSVPIQGRRPALRRANGAIRSDVRPLTLLTSTRRAEADFRFSADGTALLYRANPSNVNNIELFRVPPDGSAPPQRLSAALAPGGDVTSYELAPDQTRVVYRAGQRSSTLFELFSVPLAGGAVLALDLLPAFGDVSSFRIAPDSGSVVYLADRLTDEVLELFRVPLDGSAPPRRLNHELIDGGDVQPDYVPLPGGSTLFRADQERDDVLELFVRLDLVHRILPAPPP